MFIKLKHLINDCAIFHKRNLYYQYKYNVIIEQLLNKQIQAEQQAAQNYLNMAVAFLHPSISLRGTGGFFMKMYNEEIEHMQALIKYQIMRGGHIRICGLNTPEVKTNLTLIDAFKEALDMEKDVTKQIEEIIKVAEELDDRQCADFLTTVFLTEQMQSLNEMANHVTKLTSLGNNKQFLFYYDLKLAKLYPYSLKTK